jgi:hypothetical protein
MLDELERLLGKAVSGPPWQEFGESGDWWVGQVAPDGSPEDEGYFICKSDTSGPSPTWHSQDDLDLMIAAVNALPALLWLARSVAAERDAVKAMEAAETNTGRPLEVYLAACRETVAALADLEAANA